MLSEETKVKKSGSSLDLDYLRELHEAGPRIDKFTAVCSNLINTYRSFSDDPYFMADFEEKFIFPKLQKAGESSSLKGYIEIPRVHYRDVTSTEILTILKNYPLPIVLEGFGEASEAFSSWTPDFFKENYGDFKLPVDYSYQLSQEKGFLSLAEYVDFIRSDDIDVSKRYVQNVADLFLTCPELEEQLPIDIIRKDLLDNHPLFYIHLFLGGPGTGTDYHCANGVNFFVNIYGQKEWFFVNSAHSPWMYGMVHVPGAFGFSPVKFEQTPAEQFEQCPLYSCVPIFKTCLNPGDVLINPSWWWHAVRNVTDETIGCATRWLVPMRKSNPLYTFTTLIWCRPRILSQFFKAWWLNADPRMKDTVGRNNFGKFINLMRGQRERFWGT